MFAAHGGHEMAARALLTAGADTEVVHSGGGTALSVPPPGVAAQQCRAAAEV